MVGATRANLTKYENIISPGDIYKCKLDFTQTVQDTCEPMNIKATGNIVINLINTTIIQHVNLVWSRFRVMMFNATFNNISVILWRSVVLVEEIRVPEENHRPIANHCQS